MIRLVTYGNFQALDSRIEYACRRRGLTHSCDCWSQADDEFLLSALGETQRRIERSRNWLRKLADDVEALTRTVEPATGRRKQAARGTPSKAARSPTRNLKSRRSSGR